MNSSNILMRAFWNYFYSGREWDAAQGRQVSFINAFSIIGISCAIGFGLYRVVLGDIRGWIEVALGAIGVLNVLYLRKSHNVDFAGSVLLSVMVAMLTFLFIDGGIAGTGLYWMFTFPVLAFFIFDDKVGLQWNVFLASILLFLFTGELAGVIEMPYSFLELRQWAFSFFAVLGLLYFYTKFSAVNARILAERTQKIEKEYNEKSQEVVARSQSVERSLREKLDVFFETAGDLMCLVSKEGRFLEVNPVFEKTLGYTKEELLSLSVRELIHPEDQEETRVARDKGLRGELIENFTNRYRAKDGTYHWFMWNAVLHDDVIYGIAHPIDDLMKKEEEVRRKLEESEKLNRLMVERELTMVELKKELTGLKGGEDHLA